MSTLIDSTIKRSKIISKRKFPMRVDYENYFKDNDVWSNDNIVSSIHKHWHSRGQNGCVFAQHLAKEHSEKTGWDSFVYNKETIDINSLDNIILKAINNDEIEVLSLLFPKVVDLEQLSNLILQIMKSDIIYLEKATNFRNRVCLSLRVKLTNSNVISWLMMFAPYSFFPNTRQSPITELAIRVKEKTDNIYPRLSKDKTKAHLADTPFFLPENIVDSTWDATFRNTEDILGYKPDLIAAAKTTISFKKEQWDIYFKNLDITISNFDGDDKNYHEQT
ncbi:hypothetical protein AB1L05_20580 [Cytobacillus horneckiae]|uniref:hypothetical protein n=1 Tax=Cytobacillus horneckiae TaxID=549687 RepID=UPI0039A208B8